MKQNDVCIDRMFKNVLELDFAINVKGNKHYVGYTSVRRFLSRNSYPFTVSMKINDDISKSACS